MFADYISMHVLSVGKIAIAASPHLQKVSKRHRVENIIHFSLCSCFALINQDDLTNSALTSAYAAVVPTRPVPTTPIRLRFLPKQELGWTEK